MPALSPQDLGQLPPNIRQILEGQQAGAGNPEADIKQMGNSTVGDLNTALQRRFGQSGSYDSQFDAGVRGLMGQVPGIQNEYEQGTQRQNEDFMTNAERIGKQNEMASGRQQNQMADQGLGYSGANLLGQQRLGEALQQNVFGANQSRNRGISDLTGRLQGQLQGITSREQELEGQATERATVADQTRAWEQQQQAMADQQLKAQQDAAQQQLALQQQQVTAQQQAMAALEAQARQSVQPVAMPTGALSAPAAPADPQTIQFKMGGGADTTYNLQDPASVKMLQENLLNAGYNPGAIDGQAGPATLAALKQFANQAAQAAAHGDTSNSTSYVG